MQTLIGFDYETHPFGPENLTPKPVSLAAYINTDEGARYMRELEVDGEDDLELATSGDGDLRTLADDLLPVPPDVILVGANPAYDFAVCAASIHEDNKLRSGGYFPAIFDSITQGRTSDVQVREKLLNLAEHGDLKFVTAPDGSKRPIGYSLADLTHDYLGITMEGKTTTDKDGNITEGEDAWRVNYDVLEDFPLSEWPEDAVDYAVLDAVYPTLIWRHQEERREKLQHDLGVDPLKTEGLRLLTRFCLYLMSAEGVEIDPAEHGLIVAELHEALLPEKLDLLVEEGILRPGTPPRPYASGAKLHVESCRPGKARKTCDCPPKMSKGSKDSVNKGELERFALLLKKEYPEKVALRYSDKGNLRLDKEFLTDHAHLSPVLLQYQGRQTVQKLVTTDMPRMEWPKGSGIAARVLHASFDFLKETGRTSSYASKLYPSWNCQNPHPRIRACVVAEEGYCFYSVDYSGMELGTLAQKCLDLFGFSVLADVINKGWDAHAYLGAHLAYYLDDDFHESCNEECATPDGEQLYLAFQALKAHESEGVRDFYSHYRTFAKPTGLGYPGGLGPETFVQYAHATYKIECDVELAGELRQVWHKCFPEMSRYLEWISSACDDPMHAGKYAYSTPLGMYRAGAAYCAAANGAGLQSPSAEGALLALCAVVEATFADVGSVLYDDDQGPRHRAKLFIHDELIGKARLDVAHEVAHEVSRIMVECMALITPDVKPKAEPVLMLRWNKKAKAVYEGDRLVPWKEQA